MSLVHVAVGVIIDSECNILITRRARDAHQGGLWEFPGGKVESGETLAQALARELEEELGITVEQSSPLVDIRHDYGDKTVWLEVHVVREYSGTARPLEGQPMAWVAAQDLAEYTFPTANQPIVDALSKLQEGLSN
jgi:8-oxo-dGTP diphosphatase